MNTVTDVDKHATQLHPRTGAALHVTLHGRNLALKRQETSHYLGRKTLLNRPTNSRSHTLFTDRSG